MTNLVRFLPNNDLRRAQREIDRLFDSFFPTRPDADVDTAVWSPRVDLVETDSAYRIYLDVPGMQKDDFTISYQEGVLSVGGERRAELLDESHTYSRVERSFGRFYRSFSLPKDVRDDEITASYRDGVLTITVPKAEESRPRRIAIS